MDTPLPPKPWYIKYRTRIILGAMFSAMVIWLFAAAIRGRQHVAPADSYTIATVVNEPFLEYIDVEGIVQPIQTILINARESGSVERIVAEEGAMLDEGDTILVLSNPELLRTIDDERDEWANQQRNYHEQEIEMEQRSITLRQQALEARHEMARLDKSLRQSREEHRMGIKSRAELEVAEEDYAYQREKQALTMQSLRHDSATTILKREMLRANRNATDKRLSRTTHRTAGLVVRAPIAGQLSFLNVTLGQQVGANGNIGEIKVISRQKIHTQLSEYYVERIATGLPAHILHDGTKYPLRVSKVVPEVKDRKFVCDLVFTGDKPGNIRLGKSYRVNIELDAPDSALVIPRGDFYQNTQGEWIYKLSPNGKTAHRVAIETGRQNPQQYEIITGLHAGDRIIVSGYSSLGYVDELILKN